MASAFVQPIALYQGKSAGMVHVANNINVSLDFVTTVFVRCTARPRVKSAEAVNASKIINVIQIIALKIFNNVQQTVCYLVRWDAADVATETVDAIPKIVSITIARKLCNKIRLACLNVLMILLKPNSFYVYWFRLVKSEMVFCRMFCSKWNGFFLPHVFHFCFNKFFVDWRTHWQLRLVMSCCSVRNF